MIKPSAVILALAVVVSGVAVALAGRPAEPPTPPSRSASEVATTKATLACPAPPRATSSTLFAVSPIPSEPASSDAGAVAVTTLDATPPQDIAAIDEPGQALRKPLKAGPGEPALVTANGSLSAGLAAVQWSIQTSKSASGLAASACLPGADSWWFSGVSTAVGSTTRIVLTNPTPAIAVVDLRFYGPDGVVETVGERGIALAPQSQQSLDLARFAPGLDTVTVNAQATTGRVVAAVHTELTTGVTPAGTEWVPPSASPDTEALVNAGFADSVEQGLQLANPGDREALVKVQVVEASGAFVPSGLESVRVPPGAVVTRDLTKIVETDAAAILLTSTVPVTGAVVSSGAKPADIAITAPSEALTGPAVVATIPDADLTIAFASGVRSGGQVTIEGFGGEGRSVSTDTLNLKGRAMTVWTPAKKVTAAYFVITSTVDGATHGVAQYSGGDGITALPLVSGALTVTRPDVRPSR